MAKLNTWVARISQAFQKVGNDIANLRSGKEDNSNKIYTITPGNYTNEQYPTVNSIIQLIPGLDLKSFKNETVDRYALLSDLSVFAAPVSVRGGNFTMADSDHLRTMVINNLTLTINPTRDYRASFQAAVKNDHETISSVISVSARSGWTFRVNDNPTFSASKNFILSAGGVFTIIRKGSEQKLLLDGDLTEILDS